MPVCLAVGYLVYIYLYLIIVDGFTPFAYLYAYFVADELYGCLWMCSCFALAVGFM